MGWYMSFQRRGAAKEKTTVFSSTLSGPIYHMIWVKLHSCNCRIRQHLFCVLLLMYLMGDLIIKSPW